MSAEGNRKSVKKELSLAALLLFVLQGCGASRMENHGKQSDRQVSKVLQQSWQAYVRHFIQKDGRVIDYKASNISTSEGQSYAMLRAVWMNDRPTFDRTYTWAVNNLNSGIRNDHLWAWKWGKGTDGKWHVLDRAFASDADQDSALALILAYRTWHDPKYLIDAQAKLADLWNMGTVKVGRERYLLGGDSLCKETSCKINPSYYAPYAYRIFRYYDKDRKWGELVDTSYYLFGTVSDLTRTHQPPNWVYLNTQTGAIRAGTGNDSYFSYDAFRVYWRVAMDDVLFKDPGAENYLEAALPWVEHEWEKNGRLPAIISPTGAAKANYESLEMVAGLMPAMQIVAPDVATSMAQKLQSTYSKGFWGDHNSYYLQNWAWFGTALYHRYLGPFEAVMHLQH